MNKGRELHVIFGTGPVGIAVARALLAREKAITLVNRSGTLPRPFKAGEAAILACDLLDLQQVVKVTEGATHIYHCANPRYHQWAELLPPMQHNALEAALRNRAVFSAPENLYMYARGVDKIDEETPLFPPTRKGKLRQALTAELERAGKERGLDWVTVRASDYYGPWSGYQSDFGTDRFLDAIQKGKTPTFVGRLDVLHSYTFVGDFGEALVRSALAPSSHGRAWVCPNAPAATTREIARLFLEYWPETKSTRLKAMPKIAVRAAGIFDPVIRELVEMLYQKEEPYVVDGSRFEKEFGMPPTSLEEGVRKTMEWYRSL